jgi:hypothetical protein
LEAVGHSSSSSSLLLLSFMAAEKSLKFTPRGGAHGVDVAHLAAMMRMFLL